jgi:uncharacterized protein
VKTRYLWVIATYVAMQLSIFLLVPLHAILNISTPVQDWANSISGTWSVFSFSIGLLIILFLLKRDISERHRASGRVTRTAAIGWSIIGVFLAFFAQMIAGLIEVNVLGIDPGSENTENLVEIAKATPLFILVGAIIAPILEEIIFRKIIFGSIYQKFNSFILAGIVSSVIFAVIHFDFEHLLIYTAMGFTFAFLYVKTKRIIVPIIAHATMNTIVFVVQILFADEIQKSIQEFEKAQAIICGGIF